MTGVRPGRLRANDANGSLVERGRAAGRQLADRTGLERAREWFYGRPVRGRRRRLHVLRVQPRPDVEASSPRTSRSEPPPILKLEGALHARPHRAPRSRSTCSRPRRAASTRTSRSPPRFQAPRIAAVRDLPLEQVLQLIDRRTRRADAGVPRRTPGERPRAEPRARRRSLHRA